jgi:hypothetical protein
MKWLTQKIFNFISRFRNDVYLEKLTTTTDTSVLVIDSNKKICKNTTTLGGDITGVTIETDSGSGSKATDTAGSADFILQGGEGMNVTNSGATITVAGELASTTNKGVCLFNAADFGVGSGEVDLEDTVVKSMETDSGDVTPSLHTVTVAGGEGIDTSGLDEVLTITAEDASVTNKGVVELATAAEAITGTDTARAVTAAGLKSHVDARYAYQYMAWSASAVPTRDGDGIPEWMLPHSGKGVYEEDWNYDSGIIVTTPGTDEYDFSRTMTVFALVIPKDGILVGFHGHGRNRDQDFTFKAGLFHAAGSTTGESNATGIDYGATGNNNEFTLRCVATADKTEASGGTDGTSGENFKGPCKLVSNIVNLDVAAGDALMPAIMGSDDNSTDEIFVTMTIILATKLTTI